MRIPVRITAKTMRRVVGVAAISATMACTPIIRNHGYIPPAEDLALVQVGVDTRETIVSTLGQPTAGGVFNDQGVYYVSSRFRHFGALAPRETDRQVLAISFDTAGVVTNIERFGLEQGRVIVLSRRVTSNGASDTTFIRQLLGNLGQFNAGDFLGES